MSRPATSGSSADAVRSPPARPPARAGRAEQGVALVVVLLATMLLLALGLAVALTTSSEVRIAAAYGRSVEALYAAEALAARATLDLSALADWSLALDGSATGSVVDTGASTRVLPDGTPLDLARLTALVNCGRAVCTDAALDARTPARPWGVDNPRWRPYAYGPVAGLSPSRASDSRVYAIAWIGDDALETDGQPLVDGGGDANPGAGIVRLLVHAYGFGGTRRIVTLTLARAGTRTRVLAWRASRD